MYLEEVIKLLHGMSSVRRYSQTKLVNEESVLEHTGFVGCLSYFIGMQLIEDGLHIDMGVLFAKAMSHDIEEVKIGDIPRPTKYANSYITNALRSLELKAIQDINEKLGFETGKLEDDWYNSKDGKEGEIIAIADAIAVVYKAWQEIHIFGNKAIATHIEGLKDHLIMLRTHEQPESLKIILSNALGILLELEDEL